MNLILKEILILQEINHPNLVTIQGISCSPNNYYLLTTYFDSMSLGQLLFTEKSILLTLENKNHIVEQIVAGLTYLHLQTDPKPTIVHRDLKPGNILVNKNFDVKICDMGLCKCNDIAKSLQSINL